MGAWYERFMAGFSSVPAFVVVFALFGQGYLYPIVYPTDSSYKTVVVKLTRIKYSFQDLDND